MQRGPVLSERSESNGFAPILIVILLAVSLAGGYFVYSSLRGVPPKADDVAISPTISSTPKPTESTSSADMTNWKIYTNEDGKNILQYKNAYTIQYPTGWYISEYLSNNPHMIIVKDKKQVDETPYCGRQVVILIV